MKEQQEHSDCMKQYPTEEILKRILQFFSLGGKKCQLKNVWKQVSDFLKP